MYCEKCEKWKYDEFFDKKRCGSTARKNLTIGTQLKTGPQKTLKNKNEMDRKWPCLQNKKAKLLGQAYVAREN